MNTWAPIWSASPDSSLWDESDVVFKVFWTMMAIKDADHVVRFSAYQIGRKARKTEHETLEALRVLSEPDTKRLEPQEYDGRRIEKVEDGWLILNGQKYRDKVSDEMKKARNRKAQAAWRLRQKSTPLPGESAAVKAEASGDQAGADRITEASLPDPVLTEAEVIARRIKEQLGQTSGST